MDISNYFPIWESLKPGEQRQIIQASTLMTVSAGEHILDETRECTGLLLVSSGQLRAYIISESGREITLYRLLEKDICLFSASCIMHGLHINVMLQAEKDTSFWLIPTDVYKELMSESLVISNYTNDILASRMSDVVCLMEQVMWQSFDVRLATFLLEESALESSNKLTITHEEIANHLGTAREVVTRMLKYFQSEGLVSLSRGSLQITNLRGLIELQS